MQRISLVFNVVTTVLILVLLARIIADITSSRLAGFSVDTSRSKTPVSSLAASQKGTLDYYAVILNKGLFGEATRGSLTPLARKPLNENTGTAQNDLVLVGTVIGTSGFILVRKISTNEELVFKTGEKVFNLGVLTIVKKESAELRSNTQTITLRTLTSPAEAKTSEIAKPSSGVPELKPRGSGIIDQRALNAALDNIGQTMNDARLLPSIKDGKVEGFRVSEVKPHGAFDLFGIKNNDVLVKINEFPVDSPEKAIQSFMALKGQNRIKLDLIRDGLPNTMSYDIR